MMLYDVKEWATMFRVSRLYLRALRRKKQQKTRQESYHIGSYRLDHKVLDASRFTPYHHY
jgi:hypothetical protein